MAISEMHHDVVRNAVKESIPINIELLRSDPINSIVGVTPLLKCHQVVASL